MRCGDDGDVVEGDSPDEVVVGRSSGVVVVVVVVVACGGGGRGLKGGHCTGGKGGLLKGCWVDTQGRGNEEQVERK